jgi:hypothetical protein
MTVARTTNLPPVPESEVQSNGMEWLRAQGCTVHRRNTGAFVDSRGHFYRFSERGAADTWIIDPRGVHGEVEWKKRGERPTYDQVRWLIDHNGVGHAYAFWVDNLATLETVYRWVQAGGQISYSHATRKYRVKKRDVWFRDGDYDLCS